MLVSAGPVAALCCCTYRVIVAGSPPGRLTAHRGHGLRRSSFDCRDPLRQARFWARVLVYQGRRSNPCSPASADRAAYRSGMRVTYGKLIRDRIPEIIEAGGHHPVTRVLDGQDYRAALLAKLVEEAQEAEKATADELPGELADVWEVLRALLGVLPLTWQELEALAAAKRAKRGGFDRRIFLEYTEHATS
jgi:predicted house-cleaning noncanonical NTP pyrophosphatase (MazG superfamily)